MRNIVISAMGLVLSSTSLAQERLQVGEQSSGTKVEVTIAADFVSQYIWRGLDRLRRSSALCHHLLQHVRICSDLFVPEGIKGYQDYGHLLCPDIRTGYWQPFVTESLFRLWIHA